MMGLSGLVALVVLASASNVPLCYGGIFEDQKGSNNWKSEYIGEVEHVAFLSQHPSAVVSTRQGVLAHVKLQDGSLQWRQNLMTQGISQLLVAESESLVFTLDSISYHLQAWKLETAQLVWDTVLGVHGATLPATIMLASPKEAKMEHLIVITANHVSAYSTLTGALLWRNDDYTQEPGSKMIAHQQDLSTGHPDERAYSSFLQFASIVPGTTVMQHLSINLTTGKASDPVNYIAEHILQDQITVNNDGFLVLAGTSICHLPFPSETEEAALTCVDDIMDPVHNGKPVRLVGTGHAVVVGLEQPDGMSTVEMFSTTGGLISFKQSVTQVTAWSAVQPEEGGFVTIAHAPDSNSVKVSVVRVASGEIMQETEMSSYGAVDSHNQVIPVNHIVASASTFLKEKKFRFFMVARDSTLMYVHNQERILWTRNEGLASVDQVFFADLPPGGSAFAPEVRPPLSIADHVTLNLLVLKTQLKLVSPEETQQLVALKAENSHKSDGTRNILGTRKLIIVATESGRLFGLHSGDGRVVWSRMINAPGMKLGAMKSFRIHHNVDDAPEIMLVHSSETAAKITILNIYTGALIKEDSIPQPITQVIQTKDRVFEESSENFVFLMTSITFPAKDTVEVFVYPNTDVAMDAAKSGSASTFTWAVSQTSAEAAGYQVVASNAGLSASLAWSLSFPEPILKVEQHESPRSMPHHVKVQGDHFMRFRYLNRNSALIVTGTPDGEEFGASIVAYIIDTVTGRIMHQQEHAGARGPVATAFYDNVALLHFWDRAAFRWEMSVMEMYDKSVPSPTVWGILTGIDGGNRNTSSYTPMTLEVLKQSYFSKIGVRFMAPTQTSHGITPRNILMATVGDQVYEMDSKLLDARRPKVAKPTAAHKEERLIPYAAQLPLIPGSFASYDNLVLGVNHIQAAPAELESTTHIFAWGLDSYYVMLRPAQGFDMLDEDFSFALLIVALVALLFAVVAVHILVKKQKLKAKWM